MAMDIFGAESRNGLTHILDERLLASSAFVPGPNQQLEDLSCSDYFTTIVLNPLIPYH